MKIHKSPCVAAVMAALFTMGAHAAEWSDTSVSYRYGKHFREPANPSDISKSIVGLTHVSGFKYGSNFFNVDMLMSDHKDPASNGGGGAQEVYVVYSNQLHLSKITGQKYSLGPISDFALSTGFDINSKDDAFAARVRKFMIGPTIKFGGALGWADFSVLYYKEKNHNGIVGASVDFDPTYRLAAAWGTNFEVGPVPLQFNGFATYTASKGRDGFGNQTGPETLMDAFLMVDVGKLVSDKKGVFLVGPGYEYWRNKFGNVPGTGSKATTAMIKAEVHF